MNQWQLQDAKARLSELVRDAQAEPQEITLHGRPMAVVLSLSDYARLTRRDESLVDFMQRSPLCGDETLDFSRQPDAAREFEF